MSRSIVRIETRDASRYLQQLCKHFAHKLAVEHTPEAGRIAFASGTCRLAADDAALTLEVEAAEAGSLAHLQDVVQRHLLRFAFREPLKVQWSAEQA